MRISDLKGEKSLIVIADAMELVEAMADEPAFKGLCDEIKGKKAEAWRVVCRYVPQILRNAKHRERIISILAAIAGKDPEEYAKTGDVFGDLKDLVTSDDEVFDFLSDSPGTATQAGGR